MPWATFSQRNTSSSAKSWRRLVGDRYHLHYWWREAIFKWETVPLQQAEESQHHLVEGESQEWTPVGVGFQFCILNSFLRLKCVLLILVSFHNRLNRKVSDQASTLRFFSSLRYNNYDGYIYWDFVIPKHFSKPLFQGFQVQLCRLYPAQGCLGKGMGRLETISISTYPSRCPREGLHSLGEMIKIFQTAQRCYTMQFWFFFYRLYLI